MASTATCSLEMKFVIKFGTEECADAKFIRTVVSHHQSAIYQYQHHIRLGKVQFLFRWPCIMINHAFILNIVIHNERTNYFVNNYGISHFYLSPILILASTYQARNKPADGSGHLNKQREKTPLGQKGGQQKVHPTTNKPMLSSKNSSTSLNGRAATTTTGSTKLSNKNQKKKKHQTYDVNVTIDLVCTIYIYSIIIMYLTSEKNPYFSPIIVSRWFAITIDSFPFFLFWNVNCHKNTIRF